MQEQKGVSAIIYDDAGQTYFLLLKRASNWHGYEFPKAKTRQDETPENTILRILKEKVGLSQFKITKKLKEKREFTINGKKHVFDVYLVQSNTNIPVQHSKKKHKGYIWTTSSGVKERLQWENEKQIFENALEEIKCIQRK